jgi:hypothetical protein
MRIFLSSTIFDLKDLRDTLIHELESDGHEVIASEKGTVLIVPDKNSYEQCLAAVAECDYLIAIIDKRFGGEYPHGSRQSITEAEIEEALKKKKKTLVFVRKSVWDCKAIQNGLGKGIKGTPYEPIKNIVDDIQVFELIDRIRKKPQNNWIFQFNKSQELLAQVRAQIKSADIAQATPITQMDKLIKLSIAYCDKDGAEQDELFKRLRLLELNGKIRIWSMSLINPGDNIEQEIFRHFIESEIILVLISPDFFDYENNRNGLNIQREIIEARITNEKTEEKKTILPIVIRPTLIEESVFEGISSLPQNLSVSEWNNSDLAWLNVCKGISSLIDNKKQLQPQITRSDLHDFFCEDENTNVNSLHLFPSLKDVDDTFVEPDFFDYMCLSFEELSHVVLLHGSMRSGKTLMLNRVETVAGLANKSGYKKYSCLKSDERKDLLDKLRFIKEGIVVIDHFECLISGEKEEIIKYMFNVMNTNEKVLLVISGRIESEESLAKIINNNEHNGLYDQYKISFSTYNYNQVLKIISRIERRFNIKINHSKRSEISRYSVNSIFIVRCLCYQILKSYLDKEFYPKELNFEAEVQKVLNQMDSNGFFFTFKKIENMFIQDNIYGQAFNTILQKFSTRNNQDFVSIKRLINKSLLSFNEQELPIFLQRIEGHISEISYDYPGFFDYDKSAQQISISNIEFLFYLKNKHSISIV